jgi:hypothetical protein
MKKVYITLSLKRHWIVQLAASKHMLLIHLERLQIAKLIISFFKSREIVLYSVKHTFYKYDQSTSQFKLKAMIILDLRANTFTMELSIALWHLSNI